MWAVPGAGRGQPNFHEHIVFWSIVLLVENQRPGVAAGVRTGCGPQLESSAARFVETTSRRVRGRRSWETRPFTAVRYVRVQRWSEGELMNYAEMSSEQLGERYDRLTKERRSAIAHDAPADQVLSMENECTRVHNELRRRGL